MFFLNSYLSFWVLGLSGAIFSVIMLFMPHIKRLHSAVVKAEHRKQSYLIETIQGMRTVKSLAVEVRKIQEWDVRVATAVRARTRLASFANYPQTLVSPIEWLMYVGAVCLGAYMALVTSYGNAGTIIAFSMVAKRASAPLIQLAHMMEYLEEVKGAMAEVGHVVNQPPEEGHAGTGLRMPIEGELSFSNVRFRYTGTLTPALDQLSFTVPKGTLFGIMGRSGSGKTTVTRLLQGLHTSYEGLIKVDGVDLREIDIQHLRSNIGVVLQDNFLFSGSIRENIMAARRDATVEDVIHAARLAGAEEFIERLPRGYETLIEEGSSNLSGGQRQRIAIARALLIDPQILILDEATSALDAESEAIVNANLLRIAKGRTVIIISHRLSSLVPCDTIMVLERGKLDAIAPHAELLESNEIYRQMWFQQNRHLVVDASPLPGHPDPSHAKHHPPAIARRS